MARRRFLSTQISLDAKTDKLAKEYGDFAALLYTWMIPHAAEDASIPADPEEIFFTVCPRRNDKSIDDVQKALDGMVAIGLLYQSANGFLSFPLNTFYKYQTYISAKRRTTPQNTAEQHLALETPQNTINVPYLNLTKLRPPPTPPAAPAASKDYQDTGYANFFSLWESNMGILSAFLGERLKAVLNDSPAGCSLETWLDWATQAVHESVAQNKRSIAYFEGIMRRCYNEKRPPGKRAKKVLKIEAKGKDPISGFPVGYNPRR
mgnify:CR=1 FL=1